VLRLRSLFATVQQFRSMSRARPRQNEKASPEEAALHMLVEGFDVFGAHVQYWMPVAVVIVAVAIVVEVRST
jgi:hypothetical protein